MSKYKEMIRKTPGDTEWFVHDRFGMFIHFGLYAMPARHEWVKKTEEIEEEKYQKYFDYFNPDMLDPREWARQAKNAGMKYAVITTKHHEGFCLFDSKYTDYKITNTKYGKDLIKEYVEAFRAEGIRVGFYYSLIDWNHKDFPIDRKHPRRNDPMAEEMDKGRDVKKYAEYMRNQVTELLTNYGKIDILWFDFSYSSKCADDRGDNTHEWMQNNGCKGKEQWESEKLIETCRSLQPWLIINNRCELDQDIWTPEQYQCTEWPTHPDTGELVTWETCQTFSGSWGYYRDEHSWKSPKALIDLLVNTVSLGGNLIMNIGPTSRGYIDKRAEKALEIYGNWMKYNCRSIYGCTKADPEFVAPLGTRLTQSEDGKRLYIHLVEYPTTRYLTMKSLAGKIDYAQFLHDGSEILYREGSDGIVRVGMDDSSDVVVFYMPVLNTDIIDPVIEVFLK